MANALTKRRADITVIQKFNAQDMYLKGHHHCGMYYSSHEKKQEFGGGFVINKGLRYLTAIRIRMNKITLICAYAAIEDKKGMDQYVFYAKLEQIYDKFPALDTKIAFGYFNMEVG